MNNINIRSTTMNDTREAFPEFPKPAIAIDTVLLRVSDYTEDTNRHVAQKRMQVLLIKDKALNDRRLDDLWHLPGTILRLGETPMDAINRIIVNKTNINDAYYEQLYTIADDINRDNRGHIISIVYIGIVNSNEEIVLPEDYQYEAEWAWINKPLPIDDTSNKKARSFYFEQLSEVIHDLRYDHVEIINDTIERIKNKLMYTDIGFKFLNKIFTIKSLENTFEAINERNIPGFRRIISNKIEPTGILSAGKAYRPAALYKKKEVTLDN